MLHSIWLFIIAAFCFGPVDSVSDKTGYRWSNVTAAAEFPQGYNYPVFVWGNKMVAFNNGTWISPDGKSWKKAPLPESGLNSAYLKYVQFNGAIYALGSMTGNYEGFSVSTKILRTRDLERWETAAETSNLPQRIFYGMVVFDGKMWMIGGYDGKDYHNDVWNSADGISWTQVAKTTAWSPRAVSVVTFFKNRLWLLGGGVIDGDTPNNRNSYKEIWSSGDGVTWTQERPNFDKKWGGSPVVYDGKLWLVGMNRGAGFGSAVWVSDDGVKWDEHSAPWSPRGAVAAWVFSDKLYITGGKSSHVENGETKFVYSNDVWVMERKTE